MVVWGDVVVGVVAQHGDVVVGVVAQHADVVVEVVTRWWHGAQLGL